MDPLQLLQTTTKPSVRKYSHRSRTEDRSTPSITPENRNAINIELDSCWIPAHRTNYLVYQVLGGLRIDGYRGVQLISGGVGEVDEKALGSNRSVALEAGVEVLVHFSCQIRHAILAHGHLLSLDFAGNVDSLGKHGGHSQTDDEQCGHPWGELLQELGPVDFLRSLEDTHSDYGSRDALAGRGGQAELRSDHNHEGCGKLGSESPGGCQLRELHSHGSGDIVSVSGQTYNKTDGLSDRGWTFFESWPFLYTSQIVSMYPNLPAPWAKMTQMAEKTPKEYGLAGVTGSYA